MLKALIVDDELAAVGSLELMINKYVSDITVIGIARSVTEALKKVEYIAPDIVFLDIEMPGGTGFDFLERCSDRKFEVIFTTAYEVYALRAFRYSAVDYLLKPFGVDELIKAVEKVSNRIVTSFDSRKMYSALFENIKSILPQKLVVKIQNHSEFIDLSQISYFEMQGKGTRVYSDDGSFIHIDNDLIDLIEILDRKKFFKINDKQAVNTAKVKRVGKLAVDLANGESLPLRPLLRKELIEYVENVNSIKNQ